jgi:ankyrin repeat protein
MQKEITVKTFEYLICMLLAMSIILAGCKDDIYRASKKGDSDTLKALILEGCDINKKNRKGNVPIFLAIRNGHIDIVKILIENGADLTLQHRYCGTPLHYAARLGNIEIAKLLINAGADVNAISEHYKDTPIWYAVREGQVEMIRYLFANGADPNIRIGYFEDTLLHLSVVNISRPFETTKLLIELGLDVNARNREDRTPLLSIGVSIWTGPEMANMASLLLENGADINARDNKGMTILDYTRKKKDIELIQVLENYGGQVTSKEEIAERDGL